MNYNSIWDEPTPADDLLRGAKEIGEFIGETDRQVYYLIEHYYLPVGKVGGSLMASKRRLREFYAEVTQLNDLV